MCHSPSGYDIGVMLSGKMGDISPSLIQSTLINVDGGSHAQFYQHYVEYQQYVLCLSVNNTSDVTGFSLVSRGVNFFAHVVRRVDVLLSRQASCC
jgi:hypothetical protein